MLSELIRRLAGVRNKSALKDALQEIFHEAESAGSFPRCGAFLHDYENDYPELKELERHHALIRRECAAILVEKDRFTDIEALGGSYTAGGIHAIRWKSFMLKSGSFVSENCARVPRTAAFLKGIPGLYTAFFSILDPHQYITPHYGYWKGFLRYHLGVIIPRDNADRSCWLRVNADPADNATRDKSLVERGDKYFWREGEGVMFDDTFVHDAANDSDQIRVILWLDVRRRMPPKLEVLNRLLLEIAHLDPAVAQIRKNAIVRLDA